MPVLRYSHLTQQMTDEIRVVIAEALKQLIRQTDTLARINEHDFAILQPETTDEDPQQFTKKLLSLITELNLTTPKKNLPICVHIGVIYYPYEKADTSELFAFAELAAVRGKHLDPKTSTHHVFEPNEQTANELKDWVFWKKTHSECFGERTVRRSLSADYGFELETNCRL